VVTLSCPAGYHPHLPGLNVENNIVVSQSCNGFFNTWAPVGGKCEPCPVDTFNAAIVTQQLASCLPCPSGTSTRFQTGQTECVSNSAVIAPPAQPASSSSEESKVSAWQARLVTWPFLLGGASTATFSIVLCVVWCCYRKRAGKKDAAVVVNTIV